MESPRPQKMQDCWGLLGPRGVQWFEIQMFRVRLLSLLPDDQKTRETCFCTLQVLEAIIFLDSYFVFSFMVLELGLFVDLFGSLILVP